MKAQRLVTIALDPAAGLSMKHSLSCSRVDSHLIDELKNGWKIESITAMPVSNARSEVVMAVVLEKEFDTREYQEYKKFDTDEFRT